MKDQIIHPLETSLLRQEALTTLSLVMTHASVSKQGQRTGAFLNESEIKNLKNS